MSDHKSSLFTGMYGAVHQPTTWQQIVKRLETYRADVLADLTPKSSRVIVDLACGDGQYLSRVAVQGRHIFGYDIDRKKISQARKRLKSCQAQVSLTVRDAELKLPHRSFSVDAISIEASLGCFLQPHLVIAECYRVLKPGGVLVIQIGNLAYLLRRLQLLLGQVPTISSFGGYYDGGMLHYFTYASLAKMLTDQGFAITARKNSGVLAGLRSIWPTLLAPDIIYQATKPS